MELDQRFSQLRSDGDVNGNRLRPAEALSMSDLKATEFSSGEERRIKIGLFAFCPATLIIMGTLIGLLRLLISALAGVFWLDSLPFPRLLS